MAISKSGESAEKAILGGVSQQSRQFRVKTALSDDHLVFRSARISEALSVPFEMDLEVLSDEPAIDYNAVLGHNVTVGVQRNQGAERYFNGYITSFGFSGVRGRQYLYRATVSPWLWLLRHTENCRIFHSMSAIDIAQQVFNDHSFADFRIEGNVSPPAYDYCVQYRESDFNFISRLFEKEGIYYFFEHENGRHIMVITNSMDGHKPDDGYPSIPMVMDDQTAQRQREGIFSWRKRQQIRATHVTLQDYNFVSPRAEMNASDNIKRDHAAAGLHLYQYPGEYKDTGEGDKYATLRVEEQQANFDVAQGETNARGVRAGYRFKLDGHSVKKLNTDYLVTSTHTEFFAGNYSSGEDAREPGYSTTFTAMPITGTFRPPRVARKPLITGPQTAVVTNKTKGEEIEPVDKHGRVTVLFEWEREGKLSCPIRVSQVFAGAGWGAMNIPRHGHEVIVEFEDGNPDRPIITGRVYNGKSEPPYDPMEKPTVTTFKTSSSKGGDGFNELRFDDKKGEENIFIHGEKTMDVRIKDTKTTFVGNEHHEIIETDQFLETRGDKHETVGAEMRLKVADDISVISGSGSTYLKAASDTVVKTTSGDVHVQAGSKAVIEAPMGVTLKCGGNFITLDQSGVSIKGVMVKINSGGSALSGPGDQSQAPTKPNDALDDEAGELSNVRARSWTPTATALDSHPVSASLLGGAESGAPFCKVCAEKAGGGA